MSVDIQFLGASGTVTGSKFLLRSSKHNILIDAGMFQGDRNWREKNWHTPDFDLKTVDAVLLTHAHIDHIGILPRYRALGLKCPVFLTKSSALLGELLLIDSAKLQEEEAEYRRERKKSRHDPPLPLYSEKDAIDTISLFRKVDFDKQYEILPKVKAQWTRMGHIAGAGSINLEIEGKRVTFSGDVGRYNVPILKDPQPVELGDLLLLESTYGNRLHNKEDPKLKLAEVIDKTAKRKGVVIIPSFAVGRAQLLLYYLRELKEAKSISDIPVIVDSPMAVQATSVYSQAVDEYDEKSINIIKEGKQPFQCSKLYFTKDRSESIKLNNIDEPMIIISASGMLSGGRILHHLKHRISDPRNTILFVGYQPPGGRGAWIKSGATSLRIIGDEVAIRAEIEELSSLSAHADQNELLRWCSSCKGKPGKVAVVHGEPESAESFSQALKDELDWDAYVPAYLEKKSV